MADYFAYQLSFCLAAVVWNPHTSSGISVISAARFCFVCTPVFTTMHRPEFGSSGCYPLSVCSAVNEINTLSLECLYF